MWLVKAWTFIPWRFVQSWSSSAVSCCTWNLQSKAQLCSKSSGTGHWNGLGTEGKGFPCFSLYLSQPFLWNKQDNGEFLPESGRKDGSWAFREKALSLKDCISEIKTNMCLFYQENHFLLEHSTDFNIIHLRQHKHKRFTITPEREEVGVPVGGELLFSASWV